uniref:SET domain-containing protein n=1 Tax=Globodera pallida TaxID=36090 RepID=A0A183CEM9_GLOPA
MAYRLDLIKKCAVTKPSVLREQTEKLKPALDLGRSEHLEQARLDSTNDRWKSFGASGCEASRYLIPTKCLHWCAIALVDNSNENYARQRLPIYGFTTTNAKTERLLDAEGMKCTRCAIELVDNSNENYINLAQ